MDRVPTQPEPLVPQLRQLLSLAGPTVLTSVSFTLMQFVDGLMVAHITPSDPVYVAGQGNGGIWAFAPISLAAGVLGMVNTFVSQHLGAGRPGDTGRYGWSAIWLALLVQALLIPYALALPAVFASDLMHHEPRLVELETQYAQILIFFALPGLVTRGLAQFFFGLHRPGVVLAGSVAGNLTNIGVNFLLIYGHRGLGIPALGVPGSAIGTVIGSCVEMAIPLGVFLSRRSASLYGTRRLWRPDLGPIRDLVRLGWPAALTFGNEIVCWAIFMTALAGRFGPEHNSAGWIALRYMQLSFMPAVGLSFACTAMVGQAMGAGRADLAERRARLAVIVAMIYMAICGACFVLFRHELVGLFIETLPPPGANDPPAMAAYLDALAQQQRVARIGAQIMIVAAVFQVFDGLGLTLVGALRGAGDTVWPGVVTVLLAWTCILGLGAALALGVPQWGSLGPWIGSAVYIILLGLVLGYRFVGGRWKQFKLVGESSA